MTNLSDFVITGIRNFTYAEAASLNVRPSAGMVIVCKKDNEVIFLSSLLQSRRDKQFKPMPFFIIEKKSTYPAKVASINMVNSAFSSVISDGKESDPIRWLEKDSEGSEARIIKQQINDYGNFPVTIIENEYKEFFNQFNKPSLLFCESVSVINLSGDTDLVACAEHGTAVENSKFYLLSKEDGAITSLIDVFNKSSIYIHHI